MSKDLVIGEIKPYGSVVTGKVIKIKVTTYGHGDGIRSPNTINGNVTLVASVSSWGSSRVVFTKDQMTKTQLVEEICNCRVEDIVV